jgi:hypothetical protein
MEQVALNYWRNGHPIGGFVKAETAVAAGKPDVASFRILHDLIWCEREVALVARGQRDGHV